MTGANGSGKSTLLAALLGRLPLDTGTATLGPGVVIGEVDQARGLFLGDAPLIDAFHAAVPHMSPHGRADPACQVRAAFGARAATGGHPLPGERTRAALALLQGRGVNLLVLDEPTNHLDLPAIEQLESALASYPGTLLLVTHDRRMLAAIETNRRLRVDGGRIAED